MNSLLEDIEAVSSLDSLSSYYLNVDGISTQAITHTAFLSHSQIDFCFMVHISMRVHVVINYQLTGSAHGANFYIISLKNGIPNVAILVGNYMKSDSDSKAAFHETIGCCINAAKMYNVQQLIFGLSVTSEEWKLIACQRNGEEKMISWRSFPQLSFLCSLCCCALSFMTSSHLAVT